MLRLINVERPAFEQDPFLLLQGIQLANQYELIISPETGQLMQHFSPLLENSDPQRLRVEFEHLFLRRYALKNFEKLMMLGLLKPIFPKTVEFLLSYQGQDYQAWLKLELHKIDQLVIEHDSISINYVYAIFLTGSVLASLEQPSVSLSKINQKIDKVLTESFQIQSNTEALEEMKKMIVFCVQKTLLSKNVVISEMSSELTPGEPSLTVSDRLFDTLKAYQGGRTDGRVSRI